MFNQFCFNETLLVESLFILEDLNCNVLFLFMIVALENDTKTTFTTLFDDFVPEAKMLVHPNDILILIVVETVVCGFIENAHVRLRSR